MLHPTLIVETDADGPWGDPDKRTAIVEPGEAVTARISNPDAENGAGECDGPLWWLNSARLVADPDDDAVSCLVSIGDPRGAFCFTVRRLSDGRIVLETPYPGESLPHMETADIRSGTLVVAPEAGPSLRDTARGALDALNGIAREAGDLMRHSVGDGNRAQAEELWNQVQAARKKLKSALAEPAGTRFWWECPSCGEEDGEHDDDCEWAEVDR